jgi:hypothetical protein
VDFTVNPEQGLNGVCDFIISRSPEQLLIKVPVLMIVEAKNENFKAGMAQCAAAMIAARIFNEREGNDMSILHGTVTTGNVWKFLKLEGQSVLVDQREYHINDPGKILGVLLTIVGADSPVAP